MSKENEVLAAYAEQIEKLKCECLEHQQNYAKAMDAWADKEKELQAANRGWATADMLLKKLTVMHKGTLKYLATIEEQNRDLLNLVTELQKENERLNEGTKAMDKFKPGKP